MKSFLTFALIAALSVFVGISVFSASPPGLIDPGPLIGEFAQAAAKLAEPLIWTLAALVVLALAAIAMPVLRSLFPAPQTGTPHRTAFA